MKGIYIYFHHLLRNAAFFNVTTLDMERTRTWIDNTCQQWTFWEAGGGVNWEWRNLESRNWVLGSSTFIRNSNIIIVFVCSSAVIHRCRGLFPHHQTRHNLLLRFMKLISTEKSLVKKLIKVLSFFWENTHIYFSLK